MKYVVFCNFSAFHRINSNASGGSQRCTEKTSHHPSLLCCVRNIFGRRTLIAVVCRSCVYDPMLCRPCLLHFLHICSNSTTKENHLLSVLGQFCQPQHRCQQTVRVQQMLQRLLYHCHLPHRPLCQLPCWITLLQTATLLTLHGNWP